MTECVFCKIIEGSIPARRVYEDELVVAFWDANPTAPVHILIVPRNHVPTFNDLQDGDGIFSHMGMVARKIAKEQGIAESGYRFFINVGKGGGQVVFHLHAHLVAGRGLGMRLIEVAVGAAILWRKIVTRIGGRLPDASMLSHE